MSDTKKRKCNTAQSFHQNCRQQKSLQLCSYDNFKANTQQDQDSPITKSQTQQKLYNMLNPGRVVSPFSNTRRVCPKENQSTNRLNKVIKQKQYSFCKMNAVNEKIQQLLDYSRQNNGLVELSQQKTVKDGDQIKQSLQFIQKINYLDKEIQQMRQQIGTKDEAINGLTEQVKSLLKTIDEQNSKLNSYAVISNQVNELDKYCTQLLTQNTSLKARLSQQNDLLLQQMIKDMYLKSKTLEKTIKEMKQVFTKCVKIALHLYNKDDLPLEILMQKLKKTCDQERSEFQSRTESNLLSPVDRSQQTFDYQQKIMEILQHTNYSSLQLIKKGKKALSQMQEKYITNISESYNKAYF